MPASTVFIYTYNVKYTHELHPPFIHVRTACIGHMKIFSKYLTGWQSLLVHVVKHYYENGAPR
jgi:hypothetical protein